MIHAQNIYRLFDELWPAMHASSAHREHCLNILPRLERCFKKGGNDYSMLLDGLTALDGIGLTIASGLIWSTDPANAVPFDKFTLTYALKEGILTSDCISGGRYGSACQKIVSYCAGLVRADDGQDYKIEDFVLYARHELMHFPTLVSPR